MPEEKTSEGLRSWIGAMLASEQPLYMERSRGDNFFLKQAFAFTGRERVLVEMEDGTFVQMKLSEVWRNAGAKRKSGHDVAGKG